LDQVDVDSRGLVTGRCGAMAGCGAVATLGGGGEPTTASNKNIEKLCHDQENLHQSLAAN
jgi:hypothetical protein